MKVSESNGGVLQGSFLVPVVFAQNSLLVPGVDFICSCWFRYNLIISRHPKRNCVRALVKIAGWHRGTVRLHHS